MKYEQTREDETATSGGSGRRRFLRTAMVGGVSLAGVCPDVVTIQTDWNPEAEHGWIYEMVGDDPEIDPKLNFTFNKAQQRTVNAALSNTFGFGGHNTSVIFRKHR